MNITKKIRGVLQLSIILSTICLLSITGVYVVNQEMNKIGLWVIAYLILSIYILFRYNVEWEEEFLILTIMTCLFWKDEQDNYFRIFVIVILSVHIILIGLIKLSKYFMNNEDDHIDIQGRYQNLIR